MTWDTTWLDVCPPDPADVSGQDVWLVHPFHLADLPTDLPPGTAVRGVLIADWHRCWPWVAARWQFVGRRLQALAPRCWHGSAEAIGHALSGARRVRTVGNPHLDPWLRHWADVAAAPALFPTVDQPCRSYSQWWRQAARGLRHAEDLLA